MIAPGAWAPETLQELGVIFDVRRHVMCWFKPAAGIGAFRPDIFPIYIWDVDGTNCFYGFPATGEADEGVKAAMHSGGEKCTVVGVNREVSGSDIQEVRSYLQKFIPSLDSECKRAAVCLYTLTPDEHFIVALHPRYSQVSVAAGFSGMALNLVP